MKNIGNYEIRENGLVVNTLTGRILKPYPNPKGYMLVKMYIEKKPKVAQVHRLVAEAFIPNPENKPQVNHKDGDKTNNKVENLEWVTAKENVRHSFDAGLRIRTEDMGRPKVVVEAYRLTGEFVGRYDSMNEAARQLDVSQGNIHSVLKGNRRQTKGYYFKYG